MNYRDQIAESKKRASEFDRLARLEVKMDNSPLVHPAMRLRTRRQVEAAAAALMVQVPKDGVTFEAYLEKAKALLNKPS